MRHLEGRVAVVTGGSRGIGRAIALRFAAEGARVAVNYLRSEEAAREVVREVERRGGEALPVQADVSSKGEVEAMMAAVLDRFGRIDVLVNNAGVAADGPAASMPEEDWVRVIDVNLKGTFLCSQAAIPTMLRQGGGKIVNVSAASGLRGRRNGANYCAAKAGVIALTKCLALELAPVIQVNCLMPGFTQTEDVVARFGLDDPVARAELLKSIPMGRLATPEEIAAGAVVLASEFSDFMTGQLLAVNGGSFM